MWVKIGDSYIRFSHIVRFSVEPVTVDSIVYEDDGFYDEFLEENDENVELYAAIAHVEPKDTQPTQSSFFEGTKRECEKAVEQKIRSQRSSKWVERLLISATSIIGTLLVFLLKQC